MLGVGRLHLVGGRGFVDDLDRLRRLPDRALHLFVVEVADQDDPIPVPANRRASAWTLATSGHVASITRSPRSWASLVDLGCDAVGGDHHRRAVGHRVELVDEDAPRASRSCTTWVLCTIWRRT